ncbi:MAG: tetraacyldisaccharide 4'-kinase [Desulfuromonadales bacterium]|nr:tetraacyldisaccharide 4'-kinase [Desulfuromonadales bacterium]
MSRFRTLFRNYATGRIEGGVFRLVTGLLLPISWVYRFVISIRNLLYDRRFRLVENSGIAVISVGNIAAGGTGKTPVVDFLVKELVSRGCRVGMVSRGYGGTFNGTAALVSNGHSQLLPADQAGDEPVLLARRNPTVPIAIAPKRIDGIRLLIEECQVDCVVLDDAFQHRAVARDLDIVLLDGQRPAGNGHLLPAGILREPFKSLRRADLVILTRCGPDSSASLPLPVPSVRCRHQLASEISRLDGGTLELKEITSKRVFAFAGIAEPEAFFASLRAAKINLCGTFAFPDHVVYSKAQLATLSTLAAGADLLLTTEKDAVKLDPFHLPLPCYSVGMRLVFEDELMLQQMIDRLCEKRGISKVVV